MKRKVELSASLEDYLEAIYHIVSAKRAARAKDIAQRLGVSSSSVTGALRALSARGLINYAPYDVVTLTRTGTKVATDVVRRHQALSAFFIKVLGIDPKSAEESACKMEHELSREILDRLVDFVEFVDRNPQASTRLLKKFASQKPLRPNGS